MTLQFFSWAFDAQVKSPAELAVLLILANSANQDGNLSILRQKLADRARMHAVELDQVICSLEDGGFIHLFDPHDWSKFGICLKVNN